MTRYELREEVRQILRADGYPPEDINIAMNRVLQDISNSGRYLCQKSTDDITLATGVFSYVVKPTLIAERTLIFDRNTVNEFVINKGTEIEDAYGDGLFKAQGTWMAPNRPTYWRWGLNWLFDPIPDASLNGKKVTVFGVFDFPKLAGDLSKPDPLPERWQSTLLVYGTAAQLAPAALVRTATGTLSVEGAYKTSFQHFIRQELWEPYAGGQLALDDRFGSADQGLHTLGNIGGLRS